MAFRGVFGSFDISAASVVRPGRAHIKDSVDRSQALEAVGLRE
jgi:hypothetical protein